MLNAFSVRLRRRESVSLGRFQNCNLLEMDHFRRHGVEDESGLPGLRSKSTTLISVQWMAQLARGQRSAQSALCLGSLVARVTQDLIRGCLPALQEASPHSHLQFPSTATTPYTGRTGPKRLAKAI